MGLRKKTFRGTKGVACSITEPSAVARDASGSKNKGVLLLLRVASRIPRYRAGFRIYAFLRGRPFFPLQNGAPTEGRPYNSDRSGALGLSIYVRFEVSLVGMRAVVILVVVVVARVQVDLVEHHAKNLRAYVLK